MSKLALLGGKAIRSKPLVDWPVWDKSEEEALLDVLHSGKWWFGEKVEEFERLYAEFQGAEYGIACTNGTAALIIAIKALGIGFGDEVITTPMTFIATSTAIILAGGIPVYVDVEEDTLNMDIGKIEEAITPRTKAILPVHVFGRPLDMDRLMEIAKKHNLIVIEDAAHCWGGQYKGKGLGTIGAAGTFSFQYTKNMQSAEGGIVLTNDENISLLSWSFMNCGRIQGKPWYYMENISPNQRMTEFQAALLIAQLSRMEDQIEHRVKTHDILYEQFRNVDGIHPMAPEQNYSTRRSHHGMALRYREEEWDGLSKDRFIEAMNAEGIPITGGYGFPLYKEPAFTNKDNLPPGDYPDYGSLYLPKAEKAAIEGLLLPQTVLLAKPDDAMDIVRAAEKVYENRKDLF
ncbi:MAG: DegT/DnrJ/EryC1/StrS family aminotransferase [Candidatus Latescibacteria bacterium]|nr:DegT/DnrJ/EryC1/StrS family aminotransferase [Candidatus Latescibacterota bacterium]